MELLKNRVRAQRTESSKPKSHSIKNQKVTESKSKSHWVYLGIYFNMQVEKYMYINGSQKNQLEIVDFLYNDSITGFGPYYTKSVRYKIEHIRANVHYYE